jgi:hypothetical protein
MVQSGRASTRTHAHTPSQTTDETASGALAAAVGMALAFLVPLPAGMLSRAQPFEIPNGRSLGPLFLETSPAIAAALAVVVGLRSLQPRLPGPVRRGLEILTHDRRAIATSGPIQLASLSVIAPVSLTLSLVLLGSPMTVVGPGYVLGLVPAASAEAALPHDALGSTPTSVLVIGPVGVAAPFGLAPRPFFRPLHARAQGPWPYRRGCGQRRGSYRFLPETFVALDEFRRSCPVQAGI